GRNDAAVITGTDSGTVVEAGGVANGTPGTASANGTLSASDVRSEERRVGKESGATGYGHFTNEAAGAWSYTLNDGNADVQGLNIGDTLTETIKAATDDGSTHDVTITNQGRNDAAVITGTDSGTVVEAGGVANGTPGTASANGTLSASDV